jgi:hypothetical protein
LTRTADQTAVVLPLSLLRKRLLGRRAGGPGRSRRALALVHHHVEYSAALLVPQWHAGGLELQRRLFNLHAFAEALLVVLEGEVLVTERGHERRLIPVEQLGHRLVHRGRIMGELSERIELLDLLIDEELQHLRLLLGLERELAPEPVVQAAQGRGGAGARGLSWSCGRCTGLPPPGFSVAHCRA